MKRMKITVNTETDKAPMKDLFGIFFEDINHGADGGLYAELVRNRAFEFCNRDNPRYRPLTAWERVQEGGARVEWMIRDEDPVSRKNPHYLSLEVVRTGGRAGVRNMGYNRGISVREGEHYLFSCYARRKGEVSPLLNAAVTDAQGEELCKADFSISDRWERYEVTLTPSRTEHCGRLQILVSGPGRIELDFVSLFPEKTFMGRRGGLRRDIAEMLAQLKPRFVRFPGGSLIHGGSLNPADRDSAYRWKTTLGDITERTARRNNWDYNQSLGLGFFEYFQFCEDIGAKPIPVLPAGYSPQEEQSVPLDEMQPWIDDALDLIEFANGDKNSRWGALRASLGHPEPFGLEYLAIGNEEVAEGFFDRYRMMHRAIQRAYPNIRIINSAGPFCAGDAYEKGWESARENHSALIDEHYYQGPEWFLSNTHHYDGYREETKVFLGEYASKGNRWYNALAEAAYMTGLERNAEGVGLACYAPLLCNTDYVNWSPNLIWFDNHQVYGTANYYVQKLFMNHQGEAVLGCTAEGEMAVVSLQKGAEDCFEGDICLGGNRSSVRFFDISLLNPVTGEKVEYDEFTTRKDEKQAFAQTQWKSFVLRFKARQLGPGWGIDVFFGYGDEENCYALKLGDWGNQDAILISRTNGNLAIYTQNRFHVEQDRVYEIELKADGRLVTVVVDGKEIVSHRLEPFRAKPLYYSASREGKDIIVKLVNATQNPQPVELALEGVSEAEGKMYVMEGYAPDDANSFEEPCKVTPAVKEIQVRGGCLEVEMPAYSLKVMRVTPKGRADCHFPE